MKHSILLFKKKGCQPCQQLSESIEKDGTLLPYVNFHDIEDPINLELCEKHSIAKVPCVVIENEQGERIKKIYGRLENNHTISVEELKEFLN